MTTNATVTLLFTDLVDGTELLEQLGEDAAQVVRLAQFQLLRDAVTAHGGQVVKAMGDGLMVVFQSAVDAVDCGVAIVQTVDRHNRRSPDARFRVRMGLNVGEPTREGDDYFGLPVVLAKRLCDVAEPGQLLVSDVVRALVGPRTAHRFKALDARDLKGVGMTPMYEVDWEPIRRGAPALPAALVPAPDACFVGRDRELDRLHAAWKEAVAGTRRAVLIGGEPGVGKTRLAAEVATQVAADGIVLYGRCDEDLGVAYQPFAEALRASAASCTDEELVHRIGRSGASLARLVPELRERLPDLPAPLSVEADAERYLLFEGVAEFIAAAASEQAVLLVLDDLQWATKPTLVLLRHLLRSTVPMNVLIVGTFRDTELDRAPLLADTLADLRRDSDVERISLSGLDRASVAAFVAAAGYEASDATAELAEAVHAGTQGNAFFVGEVLRHLRESGDAALADVGLPPGVKDVVISRLTRLSATTNRVLTMASVVGPRFELSLLERLTDLDPDEVLDALDEAVRARVIVELPLVGHYTFAHALFRQVLIGELTASRRARLHWRITEALAAMPNAEGKVEELAFHSVEAGAVGDVRQAAGYALRASQRALERLAYEPAVEMATQGLDALAGASINDHRAKAELLLALAGANNFTADMAGMKRAAKRAADEAAADGWVEGQARAAVLYGRWVELGVADPVVGRLCSDALAALPDDDLRSRARVLTTLANYRVNGESQGAAVSALAEESLALARRAADYDSLAWALYLRAVTLSSTGDVGQRLALAEELVALSGGRDDSRGRLDGLVMRATTRLELGDVAGFEADTAELEELGRQFHWWAADFWAGNFRIMADVLHGRFAEGEAKAEEQFKRGAQDVNAFNAYAAQLFAARRELGALAEIEPLIAGGVADDQALIAFRSALALTWVDLGRPADAARELDALAVDEFGALPRDVSYTACLVMLTETAMSLGAHQYAAVLRRLLLPHAGHLIVAGGGIVCFGAADRYLGMLAGAAGDGPAALEHFAAAVALEEGVGSAPGAARTRYWWARQLMAGGDRAGRREAQGLLAKAVEVADNLGMKPLARQVREALGPND
ncbi:MAG: AAA family ATPase [Actinobacteria bacterium]|nr:AAA family ATPase [Actinomycetota bacterium]